MPKLLHARAPLLHDIVIVLGHFDEIGLHERDVAPRLDKPVSKCSGIEPASLVERLAAFRCQAFHSGFDRDAAGAAEQLERLRFPQIDPRLDAELDAEADEALQQRLVGQKNLVDEINVFDAVALA